MAKRLVLVVELGSDREGGSAEPSPESRLSKSLTSVSAAIGKAVNEYVSDRSEGGGDLTMVRPKAALGL